MKSRTLAMSWVVIIIALGAVFGAPGVNAELQREDWKVPPMAASRRNPVEPTESVLKKGRKTFIRTCGSCHGKRGAGDGSAGSDLEIRPTDLTSEEVQKQTDGVLFFKIYNGNSPMPAYGENAADSENKKTDQEIWAVVHYLRQLAKHGEHN